MAKVLTPLLSLNATGQLGKTIVFSGWKGIKTARQYTKPSNPRTAGQVAQREMMATIVEWWRNTSVAPVVKESWARSATVASRARSGFNEFVSAAVRAGNEIADASFVTAALSNANTNVNCVFNNLDDFAQGDEDGTFTLLYGSAPNQLTASATGTLTLGEIDFTIAEASGQIRYCQVVKTAGDFVSAPRSGIMRIEMAP